MSADHISGDVNAPSGIAVDEEGYSMVCERVGSVSSSLILKEAVYPHIWQS